MLKPVEAEFITTEELQQALESGLAKTSDADAKCTTSVKELSNKIVGFVDSLTKLINNHQKYVKESYGTIMTTLGACDGEELDQIHSNFRYYRSIDMVMTEVNSKPTKDMTMIMVPLSNP
ncbi:hypothetical protein L2E82_47225 [Cichorium intybus]|uniref:Uncharacterized protein n=1 Tax=Cichorium intybus TaxID=13427 RepID=A0ACB8YU64_CICIN|nr:hypothetical protein L2E82_47225 [Cichorium intybus]